MHIRSTCGVARAWWSWASWSWSWSVVGEGMYTYSSLDFLVSISNDDLNRLCSANNIDIRINFVVAWVTSDQVLVSLTLFQCKVASGLSK